MCRDKLDWYKTIQSTMGSVEQSAFGQLEDITKHGMYVIHVGDRIPKDIRGLVKVHILKKHPAKHEYTLEELKDLQSKLALIKGKMTEKDITDMADRFWQVNQLMNVAHIHFHPVTSNQYTVYMTTLVSVAVI